MPPKHCRRVITILDLNEYTSIQDRATVLTLTLKVPYGI